KVGDAVKRGQNLMEVLTDKATMEVPSPFAGTVTALRAEPGQQLKVGQVVLTYTPSGQLADSRPLEAAPVPASSLQTSDNGPVRPAGAGALPVRAAPSVRPLARKLGIDLTHVRGSGPGGRILLEDLSAGVRVTAPAVKTPAAEPAPHYGTPGQKI